MMVSYVGRGKIFVATKTNLFVFFMIHIDIGIVVLVFVRNLIERHVAADIFMPSQDLQDQN